MDSDGRSSGGPAVRAKSRQPRLGSDFRLADASMLSPYSASMFNSKDIGGKNRCERSISA
jgi:hypothetical protein